MSERRRVLLLRAADRQALPWKNGGGVTRELAAFPPGADLASFQWRISLADIHAAGPFSVFDGVERHLVVIRGSVSLQVGALPVRTLDNDSEVIRFGGEVPVSATPAAGGATDLNLMVKRATWRGTLTRAQWEADGTLVLPGALCFLIALQEFTVSLDGEEWRLGALDALRFEPPAGRRDAAGGASPGSAMPLRAHPPGRALWVELDPAGGVRQS
ncbi:MAG: HutD family protein [Proteobacteria bacterium]|nr:HutD family protein [Pseudomonadota bacterium]